MKLNLKTRQFAIAFIALALVGAILFLKENYFFIHNKSVSLNARWFVIAKKQIPQKGQIFAFTVFNPNAYKQGEIFIKIAAGIAGDEISIKERDFYINKQLIGTAKTVSLKGQPLTMSNSGVIPDRHFFAYTPHKDSYDSRYQEIGLINEAQIIGTAVLAF
jgi:conjugal transfer pilin signal peptidase TrbI